MSRRANCYTVTGEFAYYLAGINTSFICPSFWIVCVDNNSGAMMVKIMIIIIYLTKGMGKGIMASKRKSQMST